MSFFTRCMIFSAECTWTRPIIWLDLNGGSDRLREGSGVGCNINRPVTARDQVTYLKSQLWDEEKLNRNKLLLDSAIQLNKYGASCSSLNLIKQVFLIFPVRVPWCTCLPVIQKLCNVFEWYPTSNHFGGLRAKSHTFLVHWRLRRPKFPRTRTSEPARRLEKK